MQRMKADPIAAILQKREFGTSVTVAFRAASNNCCFSPCFPYYIFCVIRSLLKGLQVSK